MLRIKSEFVFSLDQKVHIFSISVRMSALRLLNLAFTSHYVPEFITKYKCTLSDLVSKNLKKTDEECVVSALLLANMSVQIC